MFVPLILNSFSMANLLLKTKVFMAKLLSRKLKGTVEHPWQLPSELLLMIDEISHKQNQEVSHFRCSSGASRTNGYQARAKWWSEWNQGHTDRGYYQDDPWMALRAAC